MTIEQNDHFRQDKKASTRIIQCVYDAEWLTFVPSSENKSWDVGDPVFNDTAQGQGWRKGIFTFCGETMFGYKLFIKGAGDSFVLLRIEMLHGRKA